METVWVAFHGYARAGKDTAAQALTRAYRGMTRVAFGDFIKADLDPILREYAGISAWTEDPEEKAAIRGVLVAAGYHRYPIYWARFKRHVSRLPRVVNARVFRLEECRWWVEQGGVIIEIQRPGVGPAEPREAEELERVRRAGLIHTTVVNDGTSEVLGRRVVRAAHALTGVAPDTDGYTEQGG